MEDVLMVPELMYNIISALVNLGDVRTAFASLSAASQVCWQWRLCCEDRLVWRQVCKRR